MKKTVRKSKHAAKKPMKGRKQEYTFLPKSLKELSPSYGAMIRELAKR